MASDPLSAQWASSRASKTGAESLREEKNATTLSNWRCCSASGVRVGLGGVSG